MDIFPLISLNDIVNIYKLTDTESYHSLWSQTHYDCLEYMCLTLFFVFCVLILINVLQFYPSWFFFGPHTGKHLTVLSQKTFDTIWTSLLVMGIGHIFKIDDRYTNIDR
jgi:hypothetical protein